MIAKMLVHEHSVCVCVCVYRDRGELSSSWACQQPVDECCGPSLEEEVEDMKVEDLGRVGAAKEVGMVEAC